MRPIAEFTIVGNDFCTVRFVVFGLGAAYDRAAMIPRSSASPRIRPISG